MFATLFLRKASPSRSKPLHHRGRPSAYSDATRKATMTSTTSWTDFETGEKGTIQACQGHIDGFVDDGDTWRSTVTCPFHSVNTSPPSAVEFERRSAQTEPPGQATPMTATGTLFSGNEAASLLPLRQQIIANATVLFPLVIESEYNTLFRRRHASSGNPFEVAILATSTACSAQLFAESLASSIRYQAVLTYGMAKKQRGAAVGDTSASVFGAMESLLSVLCYELGKRKDEAVEAIPESRRVKSAGGYVDASLLRKGRKA